MASDTPSIEDDVAEVIDWWRDGTSAPGGCPAWVALQGMQDAIMRLAHSTGYKAREEAAIAALRRGRQSGSPAGDGPIE